MKRFNFIVIILFVFASTSCDVVQQVVRDTAIGFSAAVIHQGAVKGGMSETEAKESIGTIFEEIGLNRQAADVGMGWRDGSLNKYDKQSVVSGYVMDGLGRATGNEELFDYMKELQKAHANYMGERYKLIENAKKTNTIVDKKQLQKALNDRDSVYADLAYDIYQNAKERRARHLADKLRIQEQLVKHCGYDNMQLAEEVAGTIIAIQTSTDFSDEEKASYLRKLGFNDIKEVEIAVSESLKESFDVEYEEVGREEAVKQLNSIVIDGCLFNRVFFTRDQKLKLDAVADILNQYAGLKVCLVGHTCEIGGKEINHRVGLQRAEVGKEYLVKKGIDPERILIDSKGDTQPVVPNSSDMNRSQNRRLEIIVLD